MGGWLTKLLGTYAAILKEALKVDAVLLLSRVTEIERVDRPEDPGPRPSRRVLISNGSKVEGGQAQSGSRMQEYKIT